MNQDLRDYLETLQSHSQLRRVSEPVDLRYLSALISRTHFDTAVLVERPAGYDLRVAGGLLTTRQRLALALGCGYSQVYERVWQAQQKGIPARVVRDSPAKDVTVAGDSVDLSALPVPVLAVADGGPYISAGICLAKDPELGYNAGIYRIQVRSRNRANIAFGNLSDGWQFYQRAQKRGVPLQVTINIGTHPVDFLAAATRTPLGKSKLDLAGGLRGEPVELVPSETVAVEGLAGAEIILECEVLPEGRAYDEGKFGEFHGLMGGVDRAPMMVVRAISRRRDAVYYALQMPWENNTCSVPMLEGAARKLLQQVGIDVQAVHATLGGCGVWHVIASIRKRAAGQAKIAILALLALGITKHVVITDDDIDVFDLEQVDWAIATRVQPERDVVMCETSPARRWTPHSRCSEEALPSPPPRWGSTPRDLKTCLPNGTNASSILTRVTRGSKAYGWATRFVCQRLQRRHLPWHRRGQKSRPSSQGAGCTTWTFWMCWPTGTTVRLSRRWLT